mmetsp:Transcript_45754/g.138715  ORF Transcript_45754/g.138715 Transcript_45754/m.138715 type:complete len:202 (+) Transcript_45754:983-1588(+)
MRPASAAPQSPAVGRRCRPGQATAQPRRQSRQSRRRLYRGLVAHLQADAEPLANSGAARQWERGPRQSHIGGAAEDGPRPPRRGLPAGQRRLHPQRGRAPSHVGQETQEALRLLGRAGEVEQALASEVVFAIGAEQHVVHVRRGRPDPAIFVANARRIKQRAQNAHVRALQGLEVCPLPVQRTCVQKAGPRLCLLGSPHGQ